MNATIAVVEGDSHLLEAIGLLIRTERWSVNTYATGEEFLDDLANNPALRCLILNSHLPYADGAQVVRAAIAAGSINAAQIIGLTAWPDSPAAKALIGLGVHTLLNMPVSAEVLIDQVQNVLSH